MESRLTEVAIDYYYVSLRLSTLYRLFFTLNEGTREIYVVCNLHSSGFKFDERSFLMIELNISIETNRETYQLSSSNTFLSLPLPPQ